MFTVLHESVLAAYKCQLVIKFTPQSASDATLWSQNASPILNALAERMDFLKLDIHHQGEESHCGMSNANKTISQRRLPKWPQARREHEINPTCSHSLQTLHLHRRHPRYPQVLRVRSDWCTSTFTLQLATHLSCPLLSLLLTHRYLCSTIHNRKQVL